MESSEIRHTSHVRGGDDGMTIDIKLALAPETIKKAEKYARSKGYTSWDEFTDEDVRILFSRKTKEVPA